MHDCIGKIKQAVKAHDVHVIYSDGEGYVLYCVDHAPDRRWYFEVYEASGDIIPYTQRDAVYFLLPGEDVWAMLDSTHTKQYKEAQKALGKDWEDE